MELADSGFDYSILSRFRKRLIEGMAEIMLLDTLLHRVQTMWLGDLRPMGMVLGLRLLSKQPIAAA